MGAITQYELLKDNRKASYTIKENEEALKTKDSNLFGRKVDANLKKKAKSRLDLKDLLQPPNIKSKWLPFQGGPSFSYRGGGSSNSSPRSFHNNQPSQESKSGTVLSVYNKGTQFQQFKKF